MKKSINKDVTGDDLAGIFKALDELNSELLKQSSEIYTNEVAESRLYKSSHYIFSIINRAIALSRAYKLLADANNYIVAAALIRLQTDNCLRLFALSLVTDRNAFYQEVLNGTHIRNLKDADGNKMTDDYLSTKLDVLYSGFKQLYRSASGFIHFSNEHLFINNEVTDVGRNLFNMKTSIGGVDNIGIVEKVDYGYNMFYAGKILFKLINGYRLSMIHHLK